MKSFSLIILSLFMVGCSSEQPHNEFLSEAEQMVFEQPDSVLRMLAPRWYEDRKSVV